MKTIHDLSILKKLALMLAAPVLGLLTFSTIGLLGKASTSEAAGRVAELGELAVDISSFLHESQKERDLTAIYLGSAGTIKGDALEQQRRRTDERIEPLNVALSNVVPAIHGATIAAKAADALERLEDIAARRSAISTLDLGGPDALGYHTGMNAVLLDIVAQMSSADGAGSLAGVLGAFQSFLKSKERGG